MHRLAGSRRLGAYLIEVGAGDRLERGALVPATELVVLDAQHVDHALGAVAEEVHRRRLVMQQLDRNALDVEAVFEGHVDQFDVEGKAVEAEDAEEGIGHVAAEALEAALGVEEAPGDDGAHEGGEERRGHGALPADVVAVGGAGEGAIANDEVEVVKAEVAFDDGKEVGAEGEVDVGEDAGVAFGGEHAGADGGAFALVAEESDEGDAGVVEPFVRGEVAAAVVDDEDFPGEG